MADPILAKDAKPGQRISLDPDGNGRIVAAVGTGFHRPRTVRITFADGSGERAFKPTDTLYLITPPEAA